MPQTTRAGIELRIENLKEFRLALKAADVKLPRELAAALRKAGEPPVERARQLAPRGPTGRLAGGFKVSTSGAAASIVNKVEYAGGAEWGRFGKWSGFARYPGPEGGVGRFAWRAVLEREEEIADTLYEELADLIGLYGFAR
jgi:hypothetical protein